MKKLPLLFITLLFITACKKGGDSTTSATQTNSITDTQTNTQPTTQTGWVQLKTFPGGKRAYGSAFVINGVAYVGSGIYENRAASKILGFDDLWQYNASADSWTRKADIPSPGAFDAGRRLPFSFVINGKGYLGGGLTAGSGQTQDINMFDPATNLWTTVTKVTTGNFTMGFAASAQNIGKIVNLNSTGALYTFYPSTNQIVKDGLTISYAGVFVYSWCSASDALLLGDDGAQIFSLTQNELTEHILGSSYPTGGKPIFTQAINYNNAVYQSFGDIGNLYKFDLTTRRWSLVINKALGVSEGAVCFNIGSKIYIINGTTGSFGTYSDSVWMIDLNHVN